MKRVVYLFAFLWLVALLWSVGANAQDPAKEEMRSTVRELQNKIMELENKMEQMDQADKTRQLENKVTEMEQTLAPYEDPHTFRAYWKDGLRMETRDKEFQMQIFGRIFNDWTWHSADESTENAIRHGLGADNAFEDGTEFRATRMGISGEIYERVLFKGEWDWVDGNSTFKDVYVGVTKIPYLGQITVGHQKEPFGLEELTSTRYITFMERAPVFAPERNTGIEIRNNAFEEHMQWQVAAHRETDDFGDSGDGNNTTVSDDGEYVFTGRITGTPWYEEEGRELLHLGLSASRRSPHEDEQRYRFRPPIHQTTRFIDTATTDRFDFDVIYDKIYLFGTEGALVYGPFSMQGEWALAHNDRKNRENFNLPGNQGEPDDDVDFRAWYVYASYFLTGENRTYKTANGVFDKIKPKDNLYDKKTGWGLGAWELGLRYSDVDLEDASVIGGEMDDITVGINWYLNPNARVMFNYVLVDLEREIFYPDPSESDRIKRFYDGDDDAFMMRFQVHW